MPEPHVIIIAAECMRDDSIEASSGSTSESLTLSSTAQACDRRRVHRDDRVDRVGA